MPPLHAVRSQREEEKLDHVLNGPPRRPKRRRRVGVGHDDGRSRQEVLRSLMTPPVGTIELNRPTCLAVYETECGTSPGVRILSSFVRCAYMPSQAVVFVRASPGFRLPCIVDTPGAAVLMGDARTSIVLHDIGAAMRYLSRHYATTLWPAPGNLGRGVDLHTEVDSLVGDVLGVLCLKETAQKEEDVRLLLENIFSNTRYLREGSLFLLGSLTAADLCLYALLQQRMFQGMPPLVLSTSVQERMAKWFTCVGQVPGVATAHHALNATIKAKHKRNEAQQSPKAPSSEQNAAEQPDFISELGFGGDALCSGLDGLVHWFLGNFCLMLADRMALCVRACRRC
ncbi:MAG: hypothetical protein MHM6MM_003373 [Cercozoa sp. M6MM]